MPALRVEPQVWADAFKELGCRYISEVLMLSNYDINNSSVKPVHQQHLRNLRTLYDRKTNPEATPDDAVLLPAIMLCFYFSSSLAELPIRLVGPLGRAARPSVRHEIRL